MGIPQEIVIVLYAMALAIVIEQVASGNATPRTFFTKLISTWIMMTLPLWGGFFS